MKDTQIISSENDHDSDYSPEECERKLWSVSDFHDFCRELNLSKKISLKCLKMLKSDSEIKEKLKDVQTHAIHERSKEFLEFFSSSGNYTFCNDIDRLKQSLNMETMNEDWCLFIDSSLTSLKAALICQKYNFPTIPVAVSYTHLTLPTTPYV